MKDKTQSVFNVGVDADVMRRINHDGHIFHINMKNYNNNQYEIIGFYFDGLGYLQTIKRDSVYGIVCRKKLGT